MSRPWAGHAGKIGKCQPLIEGASDLAEPPAPEEPARVLLELCDALNLRPGHALPLRALLHRGIQQRLTGTEIADGIEKGVELGWFELSGRDTHSLTDAGFAELRNLYYSLDRSSSLDKHEDHTCPVCLSSAEFGLNEQGRDLERVNCIRCGPFDISRTALAMLKSRLNGEPHTRARLSHAIRMRTSEESRLFVSSTNLDEFAQQSLPGIEVQLENLVRYVAAQLGDDRLGRTPTLWPDMFAGIIGAVNGQRVERLLDYGVKQGLLELDDNRSLLGVTPQGWNMIEPKTPQTKDAKDSTLISSADQTVVVSHCNTCGGDRDTVMRASHSAPGSDGEVSWLNSYEILECRGCHGVTVRHTYWFSEWDYVETNPVTGEPRLVRGDKVTVWPAPTKRVKPTWIERLEDENLREVLDELYQALNSGMVMLATIGTRTLLDRAMTLCVGDQPGGFNVKIDLMKDEGFIGDTEKDILTVIVDAGSASAHRAFSPNPDILETIIATVENFLERQFILRADVDDVEVATPKRN